MSEAALVGGLTHCIATGIHTIGFNPFDQPTMVALENIEARRPHASRKSEYMSNCAGCATRARRFKRAPR